MAPSKGERSVPGSGVQCDGRMLGGRSHPMVIMLKQKIFAEIP